jgi:hypothetical protein
VIGEPKALDRLDELRERRTACAAYLETVRRREDWHGVMDMSADIRELDAAIATLEWVLGRGPGFH